MKKQKINEIKDSVYFKWQTRASKRNADDIVFHCLASWALTTGKKRILTLPADKWLWEKQFLMHYPDNPVEFLGLEGNSRVAERMRDAAAFSPAPPPHEFKPHAQDLSFDEYAKSFKPKDGMFDMIYLDWRGNWGDDKIKQLRLLFRQGMLKTGGFLRFTVALNPGKLANLSNFDEEQHSFHIGDMLCGGDGKPHWKSDGIPRIAIEVARKEGHHMDPVAMQYYQSYSSLGEATSQVSFLFKLKS